MNKSYMISKQFVFIIVLSLSTSVIYAEVPAKDTASGRAVNQQSVSPNVQHGQPEKKAATVWALHAEQWELARSGETILSLPVLKQLLTAWLSEKQKTIEIQYPGGEDGEFWVQELTDWLVALGIPSKNMVITAGSGADDVIKFNIINKY
jgi:hypothetical protein